MLVGPELVLASQALVLASQALVLAGPALVLVGPALVLGGPTVELAWHMLVSHALMRIWAPPCSVLSDRNMLTSGDDLFLE